MDHDTQSFDIVYDFKTHQSMRVPSVIELPSAGLTIRVFSILKMLRPYFLHHRELLGDMARLAYETVRETMAVAVDVPDSRPGMVAVLQTFSSSLKWNPHIHSITSRGVWRPDGEWIPVPYVDAHRAELVFRHKILRLLRDRGLISQQRIEHAPEARQASAFASFGGTSR